MLLAHCCHHWAENDDFVYVIFVCHQTLAHQIGVYDCSDAFYESGLDKVQQAVEQYKLFYETPDFDPKQFFINKTL